MEWHVLDAKDKVLGRLATEAAALLLGKHLPAARRHKAEEVNVVVVNTDHVKLTGNKEDQKVYYTYSGYPGGIKGRNVREQRRRDSRKIVESAVAGMLPKNNLRDERMSHLRLYTNEEHPHGGQV